ncbi:hypothetical protein [Pseudophaeobacter sp.]|uniref:hypothetical protein n=1 Tax=Pseudophaeobacter sp. TaxID=1971739 RepID=UPI003298563A
MSLILALRRLPALALAAGGALALWWLLDLITDRQQLRRALATQQLQLRTAEQRLQQAAQAARIHRAHLARAAEEARHGAQLSHELDQLEGRDAPLSPVLRHTAERLFGTTP